MKQITPGMQSESGAVVVVIGDDGHRWMLMGTSCWEKLLYSPH